MAESIIEDESQPIVVHSSNDAAPASLGAVSSRTPSVESLDDYDGFPEDAFIKKSSKYHEADVRINQKRQGTVISLCRVWKSS